MLAVGNPPHDGNTGRDHGRDGRHDAHPPRGEPRVQATECDHVQTTGERAEHDVVPRRVAAEREREDDRAGQGDDLGEPEDREGRCAA